MGRGGSGARWGARGSQPPAVLIMARAPRPGEVRRALEPLLGTERCVRLQSELLCSTLRWARTLSPREIFVAHDPPDSARELRALLGGGVTFFPQHGAGIAGRLADAVGRVFARGAGPLVVLWPGVPHLRGAVAEAVLSDLRAGCDVVLGPVFDGGFYLVALARPLPALFELSERDWRSTDAMAVGLAAIREGGAEVGMLRAERALSRPADVRAALLDPLLPPPVAAVLGARAQTG
jgi:glycosyltransferase A (GT-A) superfamily protein (DUF2064 family)